MVIEPKMMEDSPITVLERQVELGDPLLAEAFRNEYHRSHHPDPSLSSIQGPTKAVHPWLSLPPVVSHLNF